MLTTQRATFTIGLFHFLFVIDSVYQSFSRGLCLDLGCYHVHKQFSESGIRFSSSQHPGLIVNSIYGPKKQT